MPSRQHPGQIPLYLGIAVTDSEPSLHDGRDMLRIPGQQNGGDPFDLRERGLVPHKVRDVELLLPGLPGTENLARPAHLEVLARYLESVVGGTHGREPFPGCSREW